MAILDGTVRDLDGGGLDLASLRGRVVLFVNVASRCGFTSQYEDLEALWRRFRDRDFVLVGVPSNDFGAQEPGSEAEIKAFCSTRYGVSFPMLAKQPVKGPGRSPLYAALGEAGGAPRWNFHKYLVGRDGALVQAFPPPVEPLSGELVGAIERALGT